MGTKQKREVTGGEYAKPCNENSMSVYSAQIKTKTTRIVCATKKRDKMGTAFRVSHEKITTIGLVWFILSNHPYTLYNIRTPTYILNIVKKIEN